MNQSQLRQLLDCPRGLPQENECVEFKEAKNGYNFDKLGKYFSALSNEANLKNQACGLLVFGVRDDRSVCGSEYRRDRAKLDGLKQAVADHTTGGLTFDEIYEVDHPNGRVVMFKIPPALQGVPTAWKGHWYGRNGESLVPLNLHKLKTINSGSSTSTVVDEFEKILLDYDHWRYDGINKAVYLLDPDYTIKIADAGPEYGAGNYWWGKLLHERPSVSFYSLRCKGEEVHNLGVIYFRSECLQVPYPSIKNVIGPNDRQFGDPRIDCYCDVFYYQRGSIEYSLFRHIRVTEENTHRPTFSKLITSQIKPPRIKLPFLILDSIVELQSLLDMIEERMSEFVRLKHQTEMKSYVSNDEKRRMLAEKLFSEWVFRLWNGDEK